jgi:hypothetical protein
MSPDDIALFLASQKAIKEEVKQMLADYKDFHDRMANERHADTIKNITILAEGQKEIVDTVTNLRERCVSRIAITQAFENHIERAEKDEEERKRENKNFLMKVLAFPIGGFLTAMGIWIWGLLTKK